MNDLKGKRLLVLGGTLATYDVVKTAQRMGAYVIVTDYLENGVTKNIADETLMISTKSIEELNKAVHEYRIDGVFTGASEFNIRNMIQLCEKAKLPVYANLAQWDMLSNKRKFKEICRQYGVPTVPEYLIQAKDEKENLKFPVIVKPVDSYSGHGISICRNIIDLEKAIVEAEKWSKSGQFIIEKYIQGENIEVYYLVQDGNIMLLSASDRYTNKEQHGSPVPTAFYHPSKYIDKYLSDVHPKVCKMFQGLGIKNGVFFMESFLENEKFIFYEMGFRLNATMEYHFVEHFKGFNPLEMMIRYALTGNMGKSVLLLNERNFNGVGCEIALIVRPGTIKAIEGIEKINKLPYVIHIIQYYVVGETITTTGSLDQNFARIKVVADNKEELENRVCYIYENVSVIDNNGNEMLIKEGAGKKYE